MKTGALIIASLNPDMENRDNEDMPVFLPMQHLDGTTVIKREIFKLRKAGVTPIIVLCGYQQEVLKNHLSHNGVVFCEDEQFESHSLAGTLEKGLEFAAELCERVLIVPVEYPAFSIETAEKLIECRKSSAPVFQGTAGWPRLQVLEEGWAEEDGFAAVSPEAFQWAELAVEDAGILYSLADENGLEHVQNYVRELRDANTLQLKLKVMLTKEEDFFGPGVYWLLRNIEETGSIQAAAVKMQMSYTKCWKMINKVEAQMGFKFVDRVNGGKHGGKSTLTEEARVFLERYRALTEDLKRISRNFFDVYFRDFQ